MDSGLCRTGGERYRKGRLSGRSPHCGVGFHTALPTVTDPRRYFFPVPGPRNILRCTVRQQKHNQLATRNFSVFPLMWYLLYFLVYPFQRIQRGQESNIGISCRQRYSSGPSSFTCPSQKRIFVRFPCTSPRPPGAMELVSAFFIW